MSDMLHTVDREVPAPVLTTVADYWRQRAAAYPAGQWVQDYWDGWQSPRRHALADVLGRFAPFHSVLEAGACCGPNLRLWRQRWPAALLVGLDLNADAIAFGQAQFADDPQTALVQADCRYARLPVVDLVVTCGFLYAVDPPWIGVVLGRLWAATRRVLVCLEPIQTHQTASYRDPAAGLAWRHDYPTRLADLWPRGMAWAEVSISPDESILIARRA